MSGQRGRLKGPVLQTKKRAVKASPRSVPMCQRPAPSSNRAPVMTVPKRTCGSTAYFRAQCAM